MESAEDFDRNASSHFYLFELREDHRDIKGEYRVYKEQLMNRFPKIQSVRFTGPPALHFSVLDLISASLSLRHINNHFFEVRLYNLSQIDDTMRKAIQEYMCSVLFNITLNKDVFESVCLATEAYDNDNMMLVVDTSVSTTETEKMQFTEVITIVANVDGVTLIAIIFDSNDESDFMKPDAGQDQLPRFFSQNFDAQIRAKGFKVSPLSHDSEESLLIYTSSHLLQRDTRTLTKIDLLVERLVPGLNYLLCDFYDIRRIAILCSKALTQYPAPTEECRTRSSHYSVDWFDFLESYGALSLILILPFTVCYSLLLVLFIKREFSH